MMPHRRLSMIRLAATRLLLLSIALMLHAADRDEQADKEADENAGETCHEQICCHVTPPCDTSYAAFLVPSRTPYLRSNRLSISVGTACRRCSSFTQGSRLNYSCRHHSLLRWISHRRPDRTHPPRRVPSRYGGATIMMRRPHDAGKTAGKEGTTWQTRGHPASRRTRRKRSSLPPRARLRPRSSRIATGSSGSSARGRSGGSISPSTPACGATSPSRNCSPAASTTDRATYERYLERFQREARATGTIQQPNVVTVYDLHVDAAGEQLPRDGVRGRHEPARSARPGRHAAGRRARSPSPPTSRGRWKRSTSRRSSIGMSSPPTS